MAQPAQSIIARFRRDQTGAVAVGFVLIAPILLALLFGIITLGYFMDVSHSVHQLASGAAHASGAGPDQIERQFLAETYLAQAGARYPLLIASGLIPAVAFEGEGPADIVVVVSFTVEDTLLDLANGFLDLGITTIDGTAYLAY